MQKGMALDRILLLLRADTKPAAFLTKVAGLCTKIRLGSLVVLAAFYS